MYIAACKEEKAQRAIEEAEELKRETGKVPEFFLKLDLGNLVSVKATVARIRSDHAVGSGRKGEEKEDRTGPRS